MSSTFHASVLRGEHDEMAALRIPLRATAQSRQAGSPVPRRTCAALSGLGRFEGAQDE